MISGKLIYLNGASSSGKTTISKELQEILGETYLHISSDAFSKFYPAKKKAEKTYSQDYLNKVRKVLKSQKKPSIVHLYNTMILSMLDEGMNVIADTTFLKYMTINEINQIAARDAFLVDVTCDLEILEEREKSRADRPIGAARKHVEFCYDYQINDCLVDTSKQDVSSCAQSIEELITNGTPKALKEIVNTHKEQTAFSLFENWTKKEKVS